VKLFIKKVLLTINNITSVVLGFAMEHATGKNQNKKKYQSAYAQLVVLQPLLERHRNSVF